MLAMTAVEHNVSIICFNSLCGKIMPKRQIFDRIDYAAAILIFLDEISVSMQEIEV